MNPIPARCLILACGNTLRCDDGIGPWLASWAETRFQADPRVRIIARQQWTPDLAEEIAQADSVLFIDCSIESNPGFIDILEVEPVSPAQGLATHHQGAPELLALSQELYDAQPRIAWLLTVGAVSTELGEAFSEQVQESLPHACALIEETVMRLLD